MNKVWKSTVRAGKMGRWFVFVSDVRFVSCKIYVNLNINCVNNRVNILGLKFNTKNQRVNI